MAASMAAGRVAKRLPLLRLRCVVVTMHPPESTRAGCGRPGVEDRMWGSDVKDRDLHNEIPNTLLRPSGKQDDHGVYFCFIYHAS
ncbi:hypothetical protein B0J18DRAFT_427811 [Chaetomium sp. MPI-SDFR-AT-0129]|nr:hypothetical protein B0J18DRAFT_427811 [Chaetomium sp. MPI-SDFR-AT-0129]